METFNIFISVSDVKEIYKHGTTKPVCLLLNERRYNYYG